MALLLHFSFVHRCIIRWWCVNMFFGHALPLLSAFRSLTESASNSQTSLFEISKDPEQGIAGDIVDWHTSQHWNSVLRASTVPFSIANSSAVFTWKKTRYLLLFARWIPSKNACNPKMLSQKGKSRLKMSIYHSLQLHRKTSRQFNRKYRAICHV